MWTRLVSAFLIKFGSCFGFFDNAEEMQYTNDNAYIVKNKIYFDEL
jgi:hypothetical protein